MTILGYQPAEIRKAIVGTLGLVALVVFSYLTLAVSVIPEGALPHLQVFVAVCTALGIFKVPNEPLKRVEPLELGNGFTEVAE